MVFGVLSILVGRFRRISNHARKNGLKELHLELKKFFCKEWLFFWTLITHF
ncbi:hypothetical protein LEP1GSC016_1296 [Leptospira borgpetersenii serovar Hardjo-bovis str. Sponselee]|uniref:Uncharacterized protein n=1 Tax=Leptospira borgpetersenii serovar Hardjo-bovis str. Sponselee TaxID=1303729 RepID=M6BYT3_LEPBO|nr:hypothetical protein LEP1GSC016_1296 [Leptospira borgpetersenii serovar Hardjo-bovis str. Sponselee]